jgi:hypothetical protein
MNENNVIRLYNYLKNNYQRFYHNSIHYSYICSSDRFYYFIQCSTQEFKIKAINKTNKSDIIIYRFSDHNELIALLNTKPLLKAVFVNIVKQLSYYSYTVLNRVRPLGTNISDNLYMAIINDFERYKTQHSDYLNRQENTIIGSLSNDQVVSFGNARNIFVNNRVERVQLSGQNMLTEERAREIINQQINEFARQQRFREDSEIIRGRLRELGNRLEELSRRLYERERR